MNYRNFRQSEVSECGLIALAAAAQILGVEHELGTLRRTYSVSSRGLTAAQLAEIAQGMGLSPRAVRCELEDLARLRLPAVLHWEFNHFVVLTQVKGDRLRIFDPKAGESWVSRARANQAFTGVAIELARSGEFKRRVEKSSLNIFSLFEWSRGLKAGLVQTLLISAVLQGFVLLSPMFLQVAVDQGAARGDVDIVQLLFGVFLVVAVFNFAAEILRGLSVQRIGAMLAWDMSRRLLRHMIKLPLLWFQKRKLADTISRLDALIPLKTMISNGVVGALVDGVLSITTLIMMLIYLPTLAFVAIGGVLVYVAVQLAFLPITLRRGMDALMATIGEQSKRIEAVRAIQTIKALAIEPERVGDWEGKLAKSVAANYEAAQVSVFQRAAASLIEALVVVSSIYLGVLSVMEGKTTVGVLYAFLAYRSQFSGRITAVVDQAMQWRLLDMYTHRLADVVLTAAEPGIDKPVSPTVELSGAITVSNLAFAYGHGERPILRQLTLNVAPGEFVAIVGASGSGKSTLLKIVAGLYPPSVGQVRYDDSTLETLGVRTVRSAIGVVLQDDELFSGTIAENVSSFDPLIEMERVWDCLGTASMAADVREMPLLCDTPVGDLGSTLSGGQKQRILLARALYRQPKILVLDEATSHVDVGCETEINRALAELKITRVVAAHRPETIAAADRVMMLQNGALFGAKAPTRPGLEAVAMAT